MVDLDHKMSEPSNSEDKKPERPWASPRLEPVDGVVQPRVIAPFGKPVRHTNKLDYILNSTLKEACKHKHAWPFLKPVDAMTLQIPHYHDKITRPMDLKTVESRIKNVYYTCAQECIDDIERVFQNCYTFNGSEDDVTIMAQNVHAVIRKSLESIPVEEKECEISWGKKKKKDSSRAPSIDERRKKEGSRMSEAPSECGSESSERKLKPGKRKAESDDDEKGETVRPSKREASIKKPPVVLAGKMKQCQKLLNEFFSKKCHDFAWPFYAPVDHKALGLHDYLKIIKTPMDMGTIKKKLEGGEYSEPSQFESDIRLMLTNCLTYNPAGDPIHILGERFMETFDKRWKEMDKSSSSSHHHSSASSSHAVKAPKAHVAPMPVLKPEKQPEIAESSKAKTEEVMRLENALSMIKERESKLKAELRQMDELKQKVLAAKKSQQEDPKTAPSAENLLVQVRTVCQAPSNSASKKEEPKNTVNGKEKSKTKFGYEFDSDSEESNKDMTYEDKRALSLLINRLPPEHLNTIVSIIQRREKMPKQVDDSEIEIDFEALGTKALREMDAFARYILKMPKATANKVKKEVTSPEKQPMKESNANTAAPVPTAATATSAGASTTTAAAATTTNDKKKRALNMSESSDSDIGRKKNQRKREDSGSSSSSSEDSDDEYQGVEQNRKGGMPPTQWMNRAGGMGGQPPTARVPPPLPNNKQPNQSHQVLKQNTSKMQRNAEKMNLNSNASKTILDTLLPDSFGENTNDGFYKSESVRSPNEAKKSNSTQSAGTSLEDDESEAERIERLRREARRAREKEDENSMSMTTQMEMMSQFEFDNMY